MARGILWAVVVNREALLEAVPPRFACVRAHHVTLRFGVALTPYEALIGRRFQARVIAEAWSDEVQAVEVVLPPELAAVGDNAHPHVTIATREDVPPKRASQMLEERPEQRPVELVLELVVEVERWGKRKT